MGCPMTSRTGRPLPMRPLTRRQLLSSASAAAGIVLSACGGGKAQRVTKPDTSGYLRFLDVQPQLCDPQRISENYTVALNVFDRLVEVDDADDSNELVPSLAESWQVSSDGLRYLFKLRQGVCFSDGTPLEPSDVGFTLHRLLTHPDSCNADLAIAIKGAGNLQEGLTDKLEGFSVLDDSRFVIELEQPCAPFLAGLSTPGASILSESFTTKAGDAFGTSPETTMGTGPFVLSEWKKNKRITMVANRQFWGNLPRCSGLDMRFYSDGDPLASMYANGEIDILDLDKLGLEAEYFLRGDIYLANLIRKPRVGITYLALNEAVAPLDDVRVRRALQWALDRQTLLQACVGGRGVLEQGIYPRGLKGYNPNLEELPYDPEGARALLADAGLGGGFDLTISRTVSANQSVCDLVALAADMWEKIGVRVRTAELDDGSFLEMRRGGRLACYTATWSADYNDPDNFAYTFFGSRANARSRSLGYQDEAVMRRVRDARAILDEDERLAEYQELERKIVHEDAAWIPLYSRYHFFMVGDGVEGFTTRWNGWSSNRYDQVSVTNDR